MNLLNNITRITIEDARLESFSMSLSRDILVGRALLKNDDGVFPLLLLNNFATVFSNIKEKVAKITAEGFLKDYSYTDYNGVPHFIKMVIVTSLQIDQKKYETNEKEQGILKSLWDTLKNENYLLLDVMEFERFSQKEGVLNECFQ